MISASEEDYTTAALMECMKAFIYRADSGGHLHVGSINPQSPPVRMFSPTATVQVKMRLTVNSASVKVFTTSVLTESRKAFNRQGRLKHDRAD